MTEGFRQWARDLRNRVVRRSVPPRRDGEQPQLEPAMPYLAAGPASRVSLTAPRPARAAANNGAAFFAKLPPEIRDAILVAAFGGRTLHMHLRLGAPLLPHAKRPPLPSSELLQPMPHGGVTADLDAWAHWPAAVFEAARGARAAVPAEGRMEWQWWGCECHRNLPPGDDRVAVGLWDDKCVRGEAQSCNRYPGEAPGKCLIGCMGWLLACRQAYAEGIDVLYGTNAIFIESRKLLDALLLAASDPLGQHVLVPPRHLALLTRLEIIWAWALFLGPDDAQRQASDRAAMAQSLGLLPRACPNLVALFLSYTDVLYQRRTPPDTCLAEIDRELLLPISAMASQLSKLQPDRCVVELPMNTSRPLMGRAARSGRGFVNRSLWYKVRFWWEPDGNENENENQPEQTHKLQRNGGMPGFWIKLGVESDLLFDFQGRPFRLSLQPSVLL